MKLSIASTAIFALSLLGVSDAARIEMTYVTGPSLILVGTTTLIGNDGKSNNLGFFMDGCKGTKYSFIKKMCIDDKKGRAHVSYTSGLKRCFKRTKSKSYDCGGPEACWKGICQRCYDYTFTEAKCTW